MILFFGHTIGAPKIAPVRHRDTEIAQTAPHSIDRMHGISRPLQLK
jgi:hypothetical protein